MVYPAKDLSSYFKAKNFDTAYDNMPDKEVIAFQTISIDSQDYEYDDEGGHSHVAIIQARILRKSHSDLLSAIEAVNSLDGKYVQFEDVGYDIFVNSTVYQGMRSTTVGLMRYAAVTIRLHY